MAKKTTKPRRKPAPKKAARKATKSRQAKAPANWRARARLGLRWLGWAAAGFAGLAVLAVVIFAFVNPPTTPYMLSESRRLGGIDRQWVDLDEISPHLVRSVVAAEDANFCLHWGFDMGEIRKALEDGGERGASTISQQVVKNVFLWHGRSWPRKALEALMTPLVEAVWTKRRIVEVYLNVAEFGEGVFGAEAAARNVYRVGPEDLSRAQAARLAALLPAPKSRSARNPSAFVLKRARAIAQGADTIRADGRADCLT